MEGPELLCLEGIMKMVDTFRILSLSINIRFILLTAFACRSELKLYSLEYKDFTVETPYTLPACLVPLPNSSRMCQSLRHICNIVQLHRFMFFPLLELCTTVNATRRALIPPSEFSASATVIEFSATYRFSKLFYTPIPMQVHFLVFIKLL